jgi:rhodanese-related sulfurtransferase
VWRGGSAHGNNVGSHGGGSQAAVPAFTAEQVQAKVQAGEPFVILDVRKKDEYDQGHIAQARLLPRGLLEFRINDVVPNKSMNILLH